MRDTREPINVTIRRQREPLYLSGWKYVACREVAGRQPNLAYALVVVLFPLYLARETEAELMELVRETENVATFHLTGTFDALKEKHRAS